MFIHFNRQDYIYGTEIDEGHDEATHHKVAADLNDVQTVQDTAQ